MRCRMCNNDKLSKEFPPVTVSKKCQHPPLVCLKCILSSSDTHCPSLSCGQLIQDDRREWFQAIWDKQFAEYKSSDVSVFETEPGECKVLYVTVLNGDAAEIEFNDSWTIMRMMTEIKKIMKFDINEQRLLLFRSGTNYKTS